jgi:hypothetical protein
MADLMQELNVLDRPQEGQMPLAVLVELFQRPEGVHSLSIYPTLTSQIDGFTVGKGADCTQIEMYL